MSKDTRPWYLSREFLLRTLTAGVYAPSVLLLTYLGGLPFLAMLLLAGFVAGREFCHLVLNTGYRPVQAVTIGVAVALVLVAYLDQNFIGLIVVAALGVMTLWISLSREPLDAPLFATWAYTLVGALYVGVPLLHAVLLRDLPQGLAWGTLAAVGTWASDTGAYMVGLTVGRHKLVPRVSPNKTWEGAVGGIVTSLVVILVTARFFDIPLVHAVFLGLIVPLAVILGDLTESALKRASRVKEAGSLLPGHGGLLDRIDGLMFAIPAVYYYVIAFAPPNHLP